MMTSMLRGRARAFLNILLGRPRKALYGVPDRFSTSPLRRVLDRRRWGPLGEYIWLSRRIPGWTRGEEAVELAQTSYSLPENAIVVEIGSFLGCSTVLFAGARKLRQSGKVHCIDPFDASGDAYSVPVYSDIASSQPGSLRARFDDNIRQADLGDFVEVHQGRDEEFAAGWQAPIDLLFLDGDQSERGARETYDRWFHFLKIGGIIAVHNSGPREYAPDHGGSRRLVENVIRPPQYREIRCVRSTTFARKMQG
jgi:MMP 1-O-methyltransferase